ncbi:hypothetical protein [Truepera radiovictrix]|uniref:N-acetyltransferase domain-containing protein n=1 Tax=Truepera radiovictrix (strain DSM 17093 / CIP 108686 / LMG 22925 / RQ-24) TaxID=649638 RepID=D7CU40_TRURR|nr:hypothetical protein [Truepera radiovictrix]ADI13938.1 hypothetical protein Trad_0804 [Truepera radiovictrix DSM 17093]WMT57498.1 hypothetical protein RCV51_00810 [Truepera radiovictrix]
MIRSIAPDELEWFIASSYDFLGHSDPRAFARRAVRSVHDPGAEAERSFILFSEGDVPLAGAYVRAPEQDGDDQNLYLSNLWFKRDAEDLRTLVGKLLERFEHEAVHCPLYNFSPEKLALVAPALEALGFEKRQAFDLEFDLAELPPLGLPLVLEAWSEERDDLFQETFRRAEGFSPSETFWAWLKRWRGPFHPNLWFLAFETLDQEPVGYACYGLYQDGVDGQYYLTAAGVAAEYRESSEMLRRLLLSSMQELAARSPFGRIQTLITQRDPKLIEILQSLGFEVRGTYPAYVKQPH